MNYTMSNGASVAFPVVVFVDRPDGEPVMLPPQDYAIVPRVGDILQMTGQREELVTGSRPLPLGTPGVAHLAVTGVYHHVFGDAMDRARVSVMARPMHLETALPLLQRLYPFAFTE